MGRSYRERLAAALRKAHERLETWEVVSKEIFGGHVSATVLSRIANPEDDYYPSDKEILKFIEPKDYKDLYSIPVAELRRRVEKRSDYESL